ncbi:hypothetical protein M231_03698 [Tremella mesenterica]|uniref:Golgi apparatus membrane protein TVP38 n=1 Tax=Tremella mesenterica TaxID=5217 RepID=A0A4Q1BMB2_TREME|nr:hypothetical protein M231_03698 [Tremella mesenterica]
MLAAVIIITPSRIGRWFNSVALSIQSLGPWGMLVCAAMVVLSSHPPLFGFAASMTLIGFIYGIHPGFLLACASSMTGGAISFLSVRRFFHGIIKPNEKWEAFGHVMKAKGLPLVIMIRYCPLPWAVGNGLFASIESVKFWHLMVANLAMQPRLLIPVFIGSRLSSLSGEEPTHDPLRFWLNLISIGLSGCFSVGTGVWIYRLTLDQMRKLDQGLPGEGELAAEALEEGRLLDDYSEEEEGEDLVLREGRLKRKSSGTDQGSVTSNGGGGGGGIGGLGGSLQRRTSGSVPVSPNM